jgi:hypothetical protein
MGKRRAKGWLKATKEDAGLQKLSYFSKCDTQGAFFLVCGLVEEFSGELTFWS